MAIEISSAGLCPSNTLVQGEPFPNYAGRDNIDDKLEEELKVAGISVFKAEMFRESSGEVKTSVRGTLGPWNFERAWYYWIATGPGLPPAYAWMLYESHGKQARIMGHCGCPDPSYCGGFGVGLYHVDTADGLKALADTIKLVMAKAKDEQEGDDDAKIR